MRTRPIAEQIPEELDAFIALLGNPAIAIELGVRRGGTAAIWHDLCSGPVIGVDLDASPLSEEEFPRYRHVQGDSHLPEVFERVSALLTGSKVDLLFIDGDHAYDGAKADFETYRELVRPGGIIAFHDIVDSELIRRSGHGVYRLWAELPEPKTEFCVHAEWGGIGVVRR